MEKDNPVQLWDGNSDDRPLRQPKTNVPVEAGERNHLESKFSDLSCSDGTKKKSELRPEAAEWFPPNFHTPYAPVFSVQERLKKARGQIDASTEKFTAPALGDDHLSAKQDIERLENIIGTLTFDPGQYNNLLHVFMETFMPHFENVDVINLMAEILFNHAVNVPNFRYTSARLCNMVEQDCPIFRSSLHTICQAKLDLGENLQGLTFFVAELYSQLHYENLYGTLLLEAFNKLLTKPDDQNVKCICQALKLTGYSLGLYNKAALNEIFEKLNLSRGSISPSTANCLNSVIKLRNEGWGQSQSQGKSNEKSENTQSWRSGVEVQQRIADDGTVFYNPTDGSELSIDEGVFLAESFNAECVDGSYSDDADELCDPEPEMDEEIQAAFKEFLKYSKQTK